MLKLFSPRSDKKESGFTLLEFLVASTVGSIVIGMTISATLSNKDAYQLDLERTRVNQNMRAAVDLITLNTRQAGENLPSNFPAIEVIDNGTLDTLVIRRNLLDEVLSVCTGVVAGTSVSSIIFGDSSLTPGCTYSDQTNNFNSWRQERIDKGGSIQAYIYNPSTKNGEFFNYESETDSGTEYQIETSSHTWANDYPVGSSAVYIIEEYAYSMGTTAADDDVLYVTINEDPATYDRVVFGLDSFDLGVELETGATQTAFARTDDWTALSFIQVDVSGSSSWKDSPIEAALSIRIFPRNILSN